MFRFKSNHTFKGWFVSIVFVLACQSVPTDSNSRLDQINTTSDFYPTTLAWSQSRVSEELSGNWYKDGNLEIAIYEDSVRVKNSTFNLEVFETAQPYARIIYRKGEYYKSLYVKALKSDSMLVAYVDSAASNLTLARILPVRNLWYAVTSTNPWLPFDIPAALQGNWHIYDGHSEISLSGDSLTLDGESWNIEEGQTNRHIFRLILHREPEYKTLYFNEIEEFKMEARLVDGTPDLQDAFGYLSGSWQIYYRWWNFLERIDFRTGSHLGFNYSQKSIYANLANSQSPFDSFYTERTMSGRVELAVASNSISGGGGGLTLKSTFQIDQDTKIDRQLLRSYFAPIQMIRDSTVIEYGLTQVQSFNLVLENDTLWYATEHGKVVFASRRLQKFSTINLRFLAHPSVFNSDSFPLEPDIFGVVTFSGGAEPEMRNFGENLRTILRVGWVGLIVANGFSARNYLVLTADKRIEKVECFQGQYYNREAWYHINSGRTDPFAKEVSFSCIPY